jgi:type IV pilus assembly protein PilN
MIEINLLPIRAARRRESIRLQSSVAALIIFLVIVCIVLLQANLKKREKAVDTQTALVQQEIAKLEKVVGEIEKLKQERAKLEQKRAVIRDLDRGRMRAAYILGELSQRTPEKIWIESLAKNGKSLKITGVALDNETIANFMMVLERSKYFGGVELGASEQINRGGMKLKKFNLHCSTAL